MGNFITIVLLIACTGIASLTNVYKNPYIGQAFLIRLCACLGIILCMMTITGK